MLHFARSGKVCYHKGGESGAAAEVAGQLENLEKGRPGMAMTTAEFQLRLRELVGEYTEGQADPAAPEGVCLATVMEDAAMALGDGLTQDLLGRQWTASLAAAEQHVCPDCGARGLHKGERPRTLQTRRGQVEISEPELYCKQCRRSFFPSLGSSGTGG